MGKVGLGVEVDVGSSLEASGEKSGTKTVQSGWEWAAELEGVALWFPFSRRNMAGQKAPSSWSRWVELFRPLLRTEVP